MASEGSSHEDAPEKRDSSYGILQYWRFNETGEYHGGRLAGDRLVDGLYRPIVIEESLGDVPQTYSEVLDLYIRWHAGKLEWYVSATGRHIPTFDDERARTDDARETRMQAESRADAVEARVRELQNELRKLRKS